MTREHAYPRDPRWLRPRKLKRPPCPESVPETPLELVSGSVPLQLETVATHRAADASNPLRAPIRVTDRHFCRSKAPHALLFRAAVNAAGLISTRCPLSGVASAPLRALLAAGVGLRPSNAEVGLSSLLRDRSELFRAPAAGAR